MSKEAAEHHQKAAEHHEQAAQHHRAVAKRHEEGRVEDFNDKRSANGHLTAALFHAAIAEAIEHHNKTSPTHA